MVQARNSCSSAKFESPRVGCWDSEGCGRGAGSDVLPELVAEGGLREGRRREALVTPTFCFPTTTRVSEAPRFESIMEDVEVGAGETARFAVVVDGKPLPDIMWYKVRGWLQPPSEHGWRGSTGGVTAWGLGRGQGSLDREEEEVGPRGVGDTGKQGWPQAPRGASARP